MISKQVRFQAQKVSNMKAFAYGFYSHVVTDSIFHPFIYRKSFDNLMRHPEKNYQHKRLEAMIDNYLISNSKQDDPNFIFDPKVECGSLTNKSMLDEDVFSVSIKDCKVAMWGNFLPIFSLSFRQQGQVIPFTKLTTITGNSCY